jgi:hypothetical protein
MPNIPCSLCSSDEFQDEMLLIQIMVEMLAIG